MQQIQRSMNSKIRIAATILIIVFFFTNCNSQEAKTDLLNRDPAVAGAFYSKNAEDLKAELQNLFLKAEPALTGILSSGA